jgi:hypothetical protein
MMACAGFAAPAEAAVSDCGTNRICFWGENSYTGCFKQYAPPPIGSVTSLVGVNWSTCSSRMQNGANSVRNEASYASAGYIQVRFYDDSDGVGPYLRFDSQVSGENYSDPYLGNGGGVAGGGATAGSNWNNRISAFSTRSS